MPAEVDLAAKSKPSCVNLVAQTAAIVPTDGCVGS